MAYAGPFDFGLIPAALESGEVREPAGYSGEPYCDSDLTSMPDVAGLAAALAELPLGAEPDDEVPLGTLCGSATFRVRRWTGPGARAEYWAVSEQGPGELAYVDDFLFACGGPAGYFAVYCIAGHPGVLAPAFQWANSDGSSGAAALEGETAAEVLRSAVEAARAYVERQIH